MNTYWGDLHNHCAASYGRGTPSRSLANARQQLDFCSVTGHAFWPDLPMDLVEQDSIIGMHLGGFAKLQHFWPELLRTVNQANEPGCFVTFPSYEWHSMQYGDHNCYSRDGVLPLLDAQSPAGLAAVLSKVGCEAMVLPHHIGYARGFRGLDWDSFDAARSPLVEIFSNHGSGEADDAGYEYHHSMGPRCGASLVREGLAAGHRFGFYASTDSHDSYPGHYGHGRVGVLADRLTRDAVWDALRNRRTIATTGARIVGEVQFGDAGIGGQTARRDAIPLYIRLEGTARFDKVELIQGDASGWVVQPLTVAPGRSAFDPGRHKVRIETGWGRGAERTAWEVSVDIEGGRLLGLEPCFRYSGYDNREQEPTEQITDQSESTAGWVCRSQPNPAGMGGGTHFAAGGTQSVILDMEANEDTRICVRANGRTLELSLPQLAQRSAATPIGGFGSPAVKVHRAIPAREFTFTCEKHFVPAAQAWGYVYIRAVQSDGQTAWVSPMWFEG